MENTIENKSASGILNGYFGEFILRPTLKTWQPKDFDLQYYSTPRRLAKETEKRNAAYKKEFDRETAWYEGMNRDLETVLSLPAALTGFFAESAKRYVEQTRNYRASLRRMIDQYEADHKRTVRFVYTPVDGNEKPYESSFDFLYDIGNIKLICYDRKEDALRQYDPRRHYAWTKLRALAPDEAGQLAIIRGHNEYMEWRSALKSSQTPAGAFIGLLGHFSSIAAKIREVLGGDPDSVSCDQNWGEGGYYNGIVAREGKRASFKSFLAGGYNIQRLHVRFRITLLKNNTENTK